MTEQERMEAAVRLDQQLCFAIYGAAHAFNRAYKPLLEPLGLTYPQYLVMLALWEKDQQTVKALGERLGLDSGTLSPLLKRLEQAGKIVKRRDRDDERQVLIGLTPEGDEMRAQARVILGKIGRATGCPITDITELRDRLIRLRDNLEQAEEDAPVTGAP